MAGLWFRWKNREILRRFRNEMDKQETAYMGAEELSGYLDMKREIHAWIQVSPWDCRSHLETLGARFSELLERPMDGDTLGRIQALGQTESLLKRLEQVGGY